METFFLNENEILRHPVGDRWTIQAKRRQLPIFRKRDEILEFVRECRAIVIEGETGSGKSTQLPQYLLEGDVLAKDKIAITQPRRVAAMALAHQVAREVGCEVGETVGYHIRFGKRFSPNTQIKYMTDGMLLAESIDDPTFSQYGCVIIDEAHERQMNTDVLLGLLNLAIQKRHDLKVIISSATLNTEKFADFFKAPILTIPGRNYEVVMRYSPSRVHPAPLYARSSQPEWYINDVVTQVKRIATSQEPGDILVFLPGVDDIYKAIELIEEEVSGFQLRYELHCLAFYANQTAEGIAEIFEPAMDETRKVIFATNIAETSLTIEGVKFVVDSGLCNESQMVNGVKHLRTKKISKAQADQRKGRAGRTATGTCYRLYSENEYKGMDENQIPGIQRLELCEIILRLKVFGVDDVQSFPFIDMPKQELVKNAIWELQELEALDSDGRVNSLGRKLTEFPLEPGLAKALLESEKLNCSEQVVTIIAMLSEHQYIFIRPRKMRNEAEEIRKIFYDPLGDHISLLNVYLKWILNDMDQDWSREHFINQRKMESVYEVRGHLIKLMEEKGIPITRTNNKNDIVRAFKKGSALSIATKNGRYSYKSRKTDGLLYIFRNSSLFKTPPENVIFFDLIEKKKKFMNVVSAIY